MADGEVEGGTSSGGGEPIEQVLFGLLRYEEVLGAVAISSEGLVVGSAGVGAQDADMVGALGAALIGATERSTRRLGAGIVREFSLGMDDGMIHVQNSGDVAVLLFTERCDQVAAAGLCAAALESIGRSLV